MVIVEIGGTVGDIEGLPFLEAIRQFRHDVGRENSLFIHVTLCPISRPPARSRPSPPSTASRNCAPSVFSRIFCSAAPKPASQELKAKISLFCNVPTDAVITAQDVESIYEVPLCFHQEGLDNKILELLNVWTGAPRMEPWEKLVRKIKNPAHGC